MEFPPMNVRAVIFDIYGTLLEVGPPPADAEARWQHLWGDLLAMGPRLGRLDFSVASSKIIARHHAAARARGILWPEVHWPSVVLEAVPEVGRLPSLEQEEFLFQQIQTGHTTRMTAATAAALRVLTERHCLLGIASNAQAYTLRELQEALATHGLNMDLFAQDLCFWSFQNGFSKPDPHAFQILTTRLNARGIAPAETLMVGDRLDNDIVPARACGWRTWQLLALPTQDGNNAGDWNQLARRHFPGAID
jgi:FMN phosphatase YigB (HAD superfamily)